MKFKVLALFSLYLCTACSVSVKPNIDAEEVMPLLNSGEVKTLGVGHDGLLHIETVQGSFFHVDPILVGYPEELLHACTQCDHVRTWIE